MTKPRFLQGFAFALLIFGFATALSGCGQQPEGGGGDQDDRGMHRSSLPNPIRRAQAATPPAS